MRSFIKRTLSKRRVFCIVKCVDETTVGRICYILNMYRILSDKQHKYLISLQQGRVFLRFQTGTPITTVQRHIKGVKFGRLDNSQRETGGSKDRAKGLRCEYRDQGRKVIEQAFASTTSFFSSDCIGARVLKDFTVINSDHFSYKLYLLLKSLNIPNDRLSISLRVHTEYQYQKQIYWARMTGLSQQLIERVEVIEGKRKENFTWYVQSASEVRHTRPSSHSECHSAHWKECGKGIVSL